METLNLKFEHIFSKDKSPKIDIRKKIAIRDLKHKGEHIDFEAIEPMIELIEELFNFKITSEEWKDNIASIREILRDQKENIGLEKDSNVFQFITDYYDTFSKKLGIKEEKDLKYFKSLLTNFDEKDILLYIRELTDIINVTNDKLTEIINVNSKRKKQDLIPLDSAIIELYDNAILLTNKIIKKGIQKKEF